jgi:SagB-type dehydrogenase family enzyme
MKNPQPRTTEEKVASFEYPVQYTFKLPAAISAIPTRFDEIISKRKSTRDFSGITLQQLSDILWYTAKVKKTFVQDNGYILTHRGTPSAGARHPIDMLIINEELFNTNLPHYYNPFEHSLNRLGVPQQTVKNFITHVDEVVPKTNATLIWFIAHPKRTAAKYENPESLIWRDAGALINSIQLTCTALNINCCAIGTLGEPYISDFFNHQDDIFGTGGLLIG